MKRITKGEKFLYTLALFSSLGTVLIKIFMGASIGNQTMENSKLQYEITKEKQKVESYQMQVNELVSFENVQAIVKELGLVYNHDNIIVIK